MHITTPTVFLLNSEKSAPLPTSPTIPPSHSCTPWLWEKGFVVQLRSLLLWQDGQDLEEESNTDGHYVIEEVKRTDEGLYKCVASNHGGFDEAEVDLDVRSKCVCVYVFVCVCVCVCAASILQFFCCGHAEVEDWFEGGPRLPVERLEKLMQLTERGVSDRCIHALWNLRSWYAIIEM